MAVEEVPVLGIGGIGIRLEREIAGVQAESFVGVAIARAQYDLLRLAEELELRPLGEFVSFSRAEREALATDMGFGDEAVAGSNETWFSPAEALDVVRGLRRRLEDHPDEVDDASQVVTELKEMETVLEASWEHRIRFHFSVDY
jgi:hypothetical protein